MQIHIKRRRHKYPIGEHPYCFSVFGAKFRISIPDTDRKQRRHHLAFVVRGIRSAVKEMIWRAASPIDIQMLAKGFLHVSDKPGFSDPIIKTGFPPNSN